MRVLLDENVDRRLKRFFDEEYEILTVTQQSWAEVLPFHAGGIRREGVPGRREEPGFEDPDSSLSNSFMRAVIRRRSLR